MSDFDEKMIEAANKKQQDTLRKEQELREARIAEQYEQMQQRQKQTEKIKNIDLDSRDEDRIKEIMEETESYLMLARNSKVFMNNAFRAKVPYFAKNTIIVGATTGSGKSTTSANLAFRAITQGQRVLVITNEENRSDVYNRVTCLIKGWPYTDHTSFTDEQIQTFKQGISLLSQKLVVVDDNYQGEMGQTTTIEGVEGIFTSILQNNSNFDVIIFDYYQNVVSSTKVKSMEPWQVQERLCKMLDSFKNAYTAPLVMLAQMKPGDDSYQNRLEGRKMLANIATCFIEINADRENLRTGWNIHKSRFIDAVGETIWTGFKNGKYVDYDADFQFEAERKKRDLQTRNARSKLFIDVKGDEDDS